MMCCRPVSSSLFFLKSASQRLMTNSKVQYSKERSQLRAKDGGGIAACNMMNMP